MPLTPPLPRSERGPVAHHRSGNPSLRRLGAAHLRHDATGAHHQNAVAHAEHFRQLARNHDDRHALRGKLAHQAMDLGFRADIDAARRLVHDQDARLGREPFRQADFLLIAARKLSDDLTDAARADIELFDAVVGENTLRLAVDEGVFRHPFQAGERHVLKNRTSGARAPAARGPPAHRRCRDILRRSGWRW